MTNIRLVTDSSARFVAPHILQQYDITVIPNRIEIGGKMYREGVDITPEEAMRLIEMHSEPPVVHSPTVQDYLDLYGRLAKQSEAIISVHASRLMFKSWDNARAAAQQLMGHCRIAVIDSQSICAGQAMLVQLAAKEIQKQTDVEEIVNIVRGAVERVYSVYYVDNMDYLMKNQIMSSPHVVLGTMLGIKPFLTIEDGQLIAIEKVRTRAQAVERLVEFLVEFTELEDAAILQNRPHMSEQTRMLQDRLTVEFPGRHFPYAVYSTSLAALIGTTGTGVAVLEELEPLEDDF